jgi:hypothetical protein
MLFGRKLPGRFICRQKTRCIDLTDDGEIQLPAYLDRELGKPTALADKGQDTGEMATIL